MATQGQMVSNSDEPTVRVKLPWPFVLSSFGALALFLIVLWASVNRLTEKVGELEITMRAGNTILFELQKDVNLLKYRTENAERRLDKQDREDAAAAPPKRR